jgi:hypothetical protein
VIRPKQIRAFRQKPHPLKRDGRSDQRACHGKRHNQHGPFLNSIDEFFNGTLCQLRAFRHAHPAFEDISARMFLRKLNQGELFAKKCNDRTK